SRRHRPARARPGVPLADGPPGDVPARVAPRRALRGGLDRAHRSRRREAAAAVARPHEPPDLHDLLLNGANPPSPGDGLDQPPQRTLADVDLLDVADACAAAGLLDLEPRVEGLGEAELVPDVDPPGWIPLVAVDDGSREEPHELAVLAGHHPVGTVAQ